MLGPQTNPQLLGIATEVSTDTIMLGKDMFLCDAVWHMYTAALTVTCVSALSESWAVASDVSCHLCCGYKGFDYEDSTEVSAMLGQVFAVIFHVTLYGLMH